MQNIPVGNLIRNVRTVGPDDSIGRAAEAVRVAGVTDLPVLYSGRVVGMVGEAAILAALSAGDPLSAAEQPVRSIMTDHFPIINPYISVSQAASLLDEIGVQAVPAANEYGMYMGLVTRSDVVSALCLTIRPPSVGGLATPLGVFLTTGNQRAGAGDLGLFLTGVSLGLFRYAAGWIIVALAWLVQKSARIPVLSILNSPSWKSPWMGYFVGAVAVLAIILFGVLLRLSPLAGYHAAEHQVVNAIENGEQLRPENVAKMSRVHPRCGTNILVAVMIFLMIADGFSNDTAVLVTIFVLIFAWRSIGGFFQYHVTTKPPSAKQLTSGIKAGASLLEKYRENPAFHATVRQRIWNLGMLQVMAGMLATMAVAQWFSPPWLF